VARRRGCCSCAAADSRRRVPRRARGPAPGRACWSDASQRFPARRSAVPGGQRGGGGPHAQRLAAREPQRAQLGGRLRRRAHRLRAPAARPGLAGPRHHRLRRRRCPPLTRRARRPRAHRRVLGRTRRPGPHRVEHRPRARGRARGRPGPRLPGSHGRRLRAARGRARDPSIGRQPPPAAAPALRHQPGHPLRRVRPAEPSRHLAPRRPARRRRRPRAGAGPRRCLDDRQQGAAGCPAHGAPRRAGVGERGAQLPSVAARHLARPHHRREASHRLGQGAHRRVRR
jgi:hypothetical protein